MGGGRADVRWFVRGDVPEGRRPAGALRRRQDGYDLINHTPATPVKRRGRRDRIEWKLRVGRVELVHVGTVVGLVERWVKYLDEPPGSRPGDRWLDVRKELWAGGGLEVARLDVTAEPWWTVAVTDGDRAGATRLLGPWTECLHGVGAPGSCAFWLLDLVARRPALGVAA